ncbi:hypothetical protein [Nocardia uniformis]|uniref:hypothetical protein n=1 Tax=Nocardia uniformis TaxID=53432 RepID=UPI0012FC2EF1|nr:hypothetical protein [Nocardia uniformis]
MGTRAIAALIAVAAPALLAAPAAADINDLRVLGATAGQQCSISTGCAIRATLTDDRTTPVDFLVDYTAIGTATPIRDSTGAISATLEWHPTRAGTYTVSARQGQNMSTIVYTVTQHSSGCGWFPTGSGTGSAGSGSADSGSADSGSAGSGSAGTGSAGSGSAGSGSASGSAC